MQREIGEVTRQRVSEALFLIGLGVVWAFDAWWPGLVVAFGIAWSTSLAIRRKYWAATVVAVLLSVVPTVYLAAQEFDVIIPISIVLIGATGLTRAFYLRAEDQPTHDD